MSKFNILDSEQGQYTSESNGVGIDEVREFQFEYLATDFVPGPSMHLSSIVRMRNTQNSEAIPVALEGFIEYDSPFDLINNGHLVPLIGQFATTAKFTGVIAAAYPMESRFDLRGPGEVTQIGSILITTGNIVGRCKTFHGVHFPDISGLPGYSNLGYVERMSWYSTTPDLKMLNAGDIQTGGAFIATGSAAASIHTSINLQSHNSLNSGNKIQFTLNDSANSKVGSIELKTETNSRAKMSFRVLTTGGLEAEVLNLNGNKNVGINGESFGGGRGGIFLANTTTPPTSNPVGGGVLYFENGIFKCRGPSGTVTPLSLP